MLTPEVHPSSCFGLHLPSVEEKIKRSWGLIERYNSHSEAWNIVGLVHEVLDQLTERGG